MASFSTVPVAGMASLNTNKIAAASMASFSTVTTPCSRLTQPASTLMPNRSQEDCVAWHGKFLSGTCRWHGHSQVLSIVVNADSLSKAPVYGLISSTLHSSIPSREPRELANVDSFVTAPVAGMAS